MNSTPAAEAPLRNAQPAEAGSPADIGGLPAGTRQRPLALVSPVKPGAIEALRARLQQLRTEIDEEAPLGFQSLGTIHYLRVVLMGPEEAGVKGAAINRSTSLVFATDYDGDEAAHLAALSSPACAAFIDSLYEHCEGYPAEGQRTPAARQSYLAAARVKPDAFFSGAPGRSLKQIRQERALRAFAAGFIRNGNWKGQSPGAIHRALKEAVFSHPEFSWAQEKAPLPRVNIPGLVLFGLLTLALLPLLIVWILVLRIVKERRDKSLGLTPSGVNRAHIRELETYEDWHNQNQFTQLLIMKPGAMRLLTLKFMMFSTRSLAGLIFVHGKLMGIPTIHFARWQMLDRNRRMIFFSNFDGSWTQYLGDFIDKSGWGLTAIWSNTINFPKTRFLFTGGAYDAEHFLAWSRHYQIPTAAWYCAYPDLSIKNVMNNTEIRNGLSATLSEEAAKRFLSRI